MSHTQGPLTAIIEASEVMIIDAEERIIGQAFREYHPEEFLPAMQNACLWAASPIALELAAFVLEGRPPDQCRGKAKEFLDRAHGKETR